MGATTWEMFAPVYPAFDESMIVQTSSDRRIFEGLDQGDCVGGVTANDDMMAAEGASVADCNKMLLDSTIVQIPVGWPIRQGIDHEIGFMISERINVSQQLKRNASHHFERASWIRRLASTSILPSSTLQPFSGLHSVTPRRRQLKQRAFKPWMRWTCLRRSRSRSSARRSAWLSSSPARMPTSTCFPTLVSAQPRTSSCGTSCSPCQCRSFVIGQRKRRFRMRTSASRWTRFGPQLHPFRPNGAYS